MDSSKHLKYYLDNRHIYLLPLFLVFALFAKAGNTGISELGIQDDALIQDISYSYSLSYGNQTTLDCCGVLGLSLSLPTNVNRLIFERTNSHIINPDLNNLHFIVKSEIPVTSHLDIPDIYWGTYFRICAILTDETRIYSSVHSINDYIDHVDLEALLNSSSIEDTSIDKINLHIENHNLFVTTPDTLYLNVFDLHGNQIYNGIIHHSDVISLNQINSPFIIASYKTKSNKIKSIKILIQ